MAKIDFFRDVVSRLSAAQLLAKPESVEPLPFELRDVHPDLPTKVRKLFDDGHYAESTFEACKFLDNFVGKHAPKTKAGEKRMMDAFAETNPIIQLTGLSNSSEIDEQRGYRFLFAGTMVAIRNPRGHQDSLTDDPLTCLDHLAVVSTLLRRLNKAGYK